MNLLRQVSVNQVEDSEAPASISTRISFSIPLMESANLGVGERKGGERRNINLYIYKKNTDMKYNTLKIPILKYTRTKCRQDY